MVSYVKFIRCTQTYYKELVRKDRDTLYFVYESNTAKTGLLYLGNKLISGGYSSSSSESSDTDTHSGYISLNDIKDVLIKENLSDRDILIYNEGSKKWENHNVQDLLECGIMRGATEEDDGLSGLVPTPHAGDQLKFLSGAGTWEMIDTYDEELHAVAETIVGDDQGLSAREIAEDVVVDLRAQVGDLETIIRGISEHDTDIGLLFRVQKIEATIGDFTPVPAHYLTIGDAIDYFDESITSINDRLRWHKMSEDIQ